MLPSLTVEGGIRYSKYKVEDVAPKFNTTTYKGGGSWEPIDGDQVPRQLSARGSRAEHRRAVRAGRDRSDQPAARSLRVGRRQRQPSFGGPTGNLLAVCLAQGAPVASIGNIQDPAAGQANATGGGNLLLRPEKANTYTLGVVIQPRDIVPGLSITVDYYNIKVQRRDHAADPGRRHQRLLRQPNGRLGDVGSVHRHPP